MIREWQALIIVAHAGHQVWKSVRTPQLPIHRCCEYSKFRNRVLV